MSPAVGSVPSINTTPNLDGIGPDLRAVPRWIHWRPKLKDDGKFDKIPTDPATGENIDHTASGNWRLFDDAVATLRPGLGLGIYLNGDGIVGVDRDGCVGDDGSLSDEAAADVAAFGSHAEISPSGRGVRIIVRGVLPPDDRKNGSCEIYGSGRFLTITGNRVPGAPATIAECQEAIEAFHAKYIARPVSASGTTRVNAGTSSLSDDEVIARAREAANGSKFMRLWAGDTSEYGGDDSAADLALLSILAFWTQDVGQLDRLFRRSGLMRDKWERADYRLRTINKALQRTEIYEPSATIHRLGANAARPEPNAGEGVPRNTTIAEVTAAFQKWLYLPDNGPVHVTLGTVAANLMDSDPVWILNVGSSSGGKTEVLNAISRLPNIHLAATLTEASLLSGTPKRDAAADSKGGLLRAIGDFGILLLKDFTSILSMGRDQRGPMLAALREIYDGSWTRHVGVDGGRTLAWSGKLGLIAGCTAAIDSHHGVMSVMGERFLLHRLPAIDPALQATRALANAGHEREMREELASAVSGLFAGLTIAQTLVPIDDHETAALVALSSLVASARSAVERDPYRREIELILDTEAPARLAQTLRRLYAGMLAIGLDRDTAWPLVRKVGLDTIPKLRRLAFDTLLPAQDWLSTTTIAAEAGYPTVTARRTLEDLAAHGVVERRVGGAGKADNWRLSDLARARHLATFSEMSDSNGKGEGSHLNTLSRVYDDISEKVRNSAPPCGESGETRVRQCWSCKRVIDDYELCPVCEWAVCSCGACSRECELSRPSSVSDQPSSLAGQERGVYTQVAAP